MFVTSNGRRYSKAVIYLSQFLLVTVSKAVQLAQFI